MKHKSNEKTSKVGEIMMVKRKGKQRGTWKIGGIDKLFVWKDGVIRGVRFKTAKGFLEQVGKSLYPLELHCNNIFDDSAETELRMTKESNTNGKLNPEALNIQPKQTAAAVASIKLNDMTEDTDI